MRVPLCRRSDRLFVALLLLVAVGLRLLYLWESRANVFYAAPIVDAKDFVEQAQRIAAGDWLGGDRPFWQPPLYPYFLALWYALFPSSFFTVVRLAQALLGVLTCLLVRDLAARAFDTRTARLAAMAAAAYGVAIYFEGELLAVSLETFLNLLLVRSLLWATDRRRAGAWLAVGALAGLAALTRPNVLLFAAAAALWTAAARRAGPQALPVRVRLARCLLFAAGVALTIAPVTARNLLVGNDLVLISHNAGINFYIGNNAHYDSTVAIHPGQHWENLVAEPALAGIAAPSARSRYFVRKAVAFIAAEPLSYARLMAKKVWLYLNGAEIKRNQDVYYSRSYSRLLRLLIWDRGIAFPFGLVAPLALAGLALTRRTGNRAATLLRLYALAHSASVLLFFVTARYRLPVVPALLPFAAWTVLRVAALLRARAWTGAAAPVAAVALLTVLLNQQRASVPERDAQLHHDIGEAHLRKREYEPAMAHLQQALALEPDYASAWHNLAVAYLEQHRYEEARTAARAALRWQPPRADTQAVLGQCLAATGDLEQAEAAFRRSLELDPGRSATHHQYADLLMRQQRFTEAVHHMKQARRSGPAGYWVLYDTGRALNGAGNAAAALREFEAACRLDPRRPQGWVAAGNAALAAGDVARARQYLDRALALAPDDPYALGNLGRVELASGSPARAVELLLRAVAQDPAVASFRAALAEARAAAAEHGSGTEPQAMPATP